MALSSDSSITFGSMAYAGRGDFALDSNVKESVHLGVPSGKTGSLDASTAKAPVMLGKDNGGVPAGPDGGEGRHANKPVGGDGGPPVKPDRDGTTYAAYEEIPADVLATKPKGSPVVETWYTQHHGTVTVDKDGTWTYTNEQGVPVTYHVIYPDFYSAGLIGRDASLKQFPDRFIDRKRD